MKLTPEELRALVQQAPSLAAGLSTPPGLGTNAGTYLIDVDLPDTAALEFLRESAELVVSTRPGDTLDAVVRSTRLSRDTAAEVIERIDRGDDPQEIMSFVHGALRRGRSDGNEAPPRDADE